MCGLAAVESRSIDCADLRSNPTLRRGHERRLIKREQKAEQPTSSHRKVEQDTTPSIISTKHLAESTSRAQSRSARESPAVCSREANNGGRHISRRAWGRGPMVRLPKRYKEELRRVAPNWAARPARGKARQRTATKTKKTRARLDRGPRFTEGRTNACCPCCPPTAGRISDVTGTAAGARFDAELGFQE